MSFRLVPKYVTLKGVMPLILRYLTEFMYDVVVKQLPRFQNLLLLVYGNTSAICAITQRLFGRNKF